MEVVASCKKANRPKRRAQQKPYIDQGKLAKKMAKMAHTTVKPATARPSVDQCCGVPLLADRASLWLLTQHA